MTLKITYSYGLTCKAHCNKYRENNHLKNASNAKIFPKHYEWTKISIAWSFAIYRVVAHSRYSKCK